MMKIDSNDNRPCWACGSRPAEHRHQPVPCEDKLLWLCDACHAHVQGGELRALEHRQAGRIATAKAGKRATGFTPYGWDCKRDGSLTENPKEQEWLRFILDAHAKGQSCWSIARELNLQGVATKVRGQWWPKTIAKIVERGGLPTSLLKEVA